MNWWKALILGTVQGLAEFLPISSSGHLVIIRSVLGLQTIGLAFDTFLHLGSLLAVLFFFRDDLVPLVRGGLSLLGRLVGLRRGSLSSHELLAGLILVASIPAALAGLILDPVFERLFSSPRLTGFALWVTAGIMWWAHRLRAGSRPMPAMGPWRALAVGAAQAVAITPGISRSGSTIFAGLLAGLSRDDAARFSFLLSIPVILGAAMTQVDSLARIPDLNLAVLLLGMGSAAVAGFVAIKAVLSLVKRGGFAIFAVYCAVVGTLVILFV